MPLFTIDADKCLRDGSCALECPVGCIVFERDQIPVPHKKKFAYCIGCGHCMAVCPKGAFQLEQFSEKSFCKDSALKVSKEQVEQFLKGRRSVRSFRNESVGSDLLEGLLDLTQYAPSGHNARPVRWAVAANSKKVAGIAKNTINWMRGEVDAKSEVAESLHLDGIVRAWDDGVDLVCRHAPALAVAFGPKKGITPVEDGIIAITYLELAATGANLGACWCGYVHMAANQDEAIRHALGIPKGYRAFGALMLGYPVRRFGGISPRPKAEINWL